MILKVKWKRSKNGRKCHLDSDSDSLDGSSPLALSGTSFSLWVLFAC